MPLANEPLDGPYPYDVKINGSGYVLARGIEPSLPFRTQRAKYAYTPTFIERSNTSGNFGDNQQDFWLTAAQNDWSLGEDQHFFDPNDAEKSRKYLTGENVTPITPGQVRLRFNMGQVLGASAPITAGVATDNQFYGFSAAELYSIVNNTWPSADTLGALAAHGLSATPTCAAYDGDNLYFSSASASSVRRYNVAGASFASYSASPADQLLYLNNTLYGTKGGVFYTYASTGAASASFAFKDAVGATLSAYKSRLIGLGGKVIVLRTGPVFPTLWQWDGSGMSKLAEFPNNFTATDICVVDGIVFIVGLENQPTAQFVGTAPSTRTAVWFYSSSSIGRTWANDSYATTTIYPAITALGDGFAFTDSVNKTTRIYDLSEGAVVTMCDASIFSGTSFFADQNVMGMDGNAFGFFVWNSVNDDIYELTGTPGSGFFVSSQIDFDSSLKKLMRGITVFFDNPGGGPTVDISYALDGATSFTSLKTGASSGVEYPLPANTTGFSVSVKITLNGSLTPTATASPVVKRLYVRAAPLNTQFRTSEYIFDMSATQGKTPVVLNNNQPHPKTGRQQLDTLLADVTSTTPFTVIDRLGTFTAVADLANMEILELRQEQFYVRLPVRQV